MDNRRELTDRIRSALPGQLPVREVKMFGGLSFMVNERMAVGVFGGGALLVRTDPERDDELLAVPGARPAEMGAGRVMGPGWIAVDHAAVATRDDLDFWIGVALEHNRTQPGERGRSRRRTDV